MTGATMSESAPASRTELRLIADDNARGATSAPFLMSAFALETSFAVFAANQVIGAHGTQQPSRALLLFSDLLDRVVAPVRFARLEYGPVSLRQSWPNRDRLTNLS